MNESQSNSEKLLALVERIAIALEGGKGQTKPTISKAAPNCPICNGPMLARKRRSDQSDFWGCKAYPDCKGTCNADGTPTVIKNKPVPEDNYQDDIPF